MTSTDNFIDREPQIAFFYQLIATKQIAQPLVKVVGPSGVGKSALLHQFHAICREFRVPVAFIYGDRTRTVVSLLKEIAEQLREYCGPFTFREFNAVLRQTYQIQDKLLLSKKDTVKKQLFGPLKLLGRGITTAASVAAGTDILLAAAAEVIGEVFIDGVEKHFDKLADSGLSQEQISLLNDLGSQLLRSFTIGFARVQESLRTVILIDGIENMLHLESFLAQHLIPALDDQNTIFVVSNRMRFNSCWLDLAPKSNILELEPFSLKDVYAFLSHRSSNVSRNTARAVFELTDGLPLSLALWCEFVPAAPTSTKASFTREKSLAVALQIEQHLLDQFPDQQLKDIVSICASFHHFDENLLAYVLDCTPNEAKATFDSLSAYSSIFRLHASGLAVHELLRKYLVDSFQRSNLSHYNQIIKRAVDYYGIKVEESPWAEKGRHGIEYVYYAAILEGQKDLLALFFNEYGTGSITVMPARQRDILEILEVDWKAFPHEENRITLERLSRWFNVSPDSFRVARDEHQRILGYSCILRLTPAVAQAVVDGNLSFKEINESHLLDSGSTSTVDYMLDSLAIADQSRSDVGAALLRDMLAQVRGRVGRLLSVAVTRQGSAILQRTGFRLVRTLPEEIDGFHYEVFELDLRDDMHHSLLADVLRKYSIQ